MSPADLCIAQSPAISAIYLGLLTSGYDFFHVERDARHAEALHPFRTAMEPQPFFLQARQSTCEAYPYWPRAALMEAAAFHLTDSCDGWCSRDDLYQDVMSAGNLADPERDAAFWAWLDQFPAALRQVMDSPCFSDYLQWEQGWIEEQNRRYADDLRRIGSMLHSCLEMYHSPVTSLKIILNPVKCVYSADYHMVHNCFIFISGRFQLQSVMHEFLHHVVHPYVAAHKDDIRPHRQYPDIDRSYYAAGPENAFEEYMVRQLTQRAMEGRMPDDLHHYLQLLSDSQEP